MSVLARIPRLPVPAAFLPAQPALAAEVGERSICVARMTLSGGKPSLAGFWAGELPDGAVRCSALNANIVDAEAVRAQVRAAKARVAPSGGPLALCLPDVVARVALLQLDALPARSAEIQELVTWRLKKQLPYRVDEARVAWRVLAAREGHVPVIAAAVRRKVLAEYEEVFAAEGFHVGAVTTSSLALAESLPRTPGDVLLVHAAHGWFSLLWSDGQQPILLRTKQLPASDHEGETRDAAIAAEIAPTIEYARERLARAQAPRLLVHDGCGRGESLVARLAEATQLPTSRLHPTPPGSPDDTADRLGAACSLALRGLGDVRPAQEARP